MRKADNPHMKPKRLLRRNHDKIASIRAGLQKDESLTRHEQAGMAHTLLDVCDELYDLLERFEDGEG